MSDHALEGLIRAVTIVFILSLAIERMANLLKSRNWQPLRRKRDGKGKSKTGRFIIDISRSTVVHRNAAGMETPILDKGLCKAQVQAVHSENTMFLGMLLAFASGCNAFEGLIGPGPFGGFFAQHAVLAYFWNLPQILLTGAAAAIGSSFWYDMLGILMEVRRTKQSLALPDPDAGQGVPGKTAAPSPFQRLRAAAEEEVDAWIKQGTIKSGRVIDDPVSPFLTVYVDPATGADLSGKTMDLVLDGKSFKLPVHVKPQA